MTVRNYFEQINFALKECGAWATKVPLKTVTLPLVTVEVSLMAVFQ
ncbi:hypothetical protein [Vibrio sp. F13]|nr:hypothetical protein [Vibrio sp. F13]